MITRRRSCTECFGCLRVCRPVCTRAARPRVFPIPTYWQPSRPRCAHRVTTFHCTHASHTCVSSFAHRRCIIRHRSTSVLLQKLLPLKTTDRHVRSAIMSKGVSCAVPARCNCSPAMCGFRMPTGERGRRCASHLCAPHGPNKNPRDTRLSECWRACAISFMCRLRPGAQVG
jgi:hypothetical protein